MYIILYIYICIYICIYEKKISCSVRDCIGITWLIYLKNEIKLLSALTLGIREQIWFCH